MRTYRKRTHHARSSSICLQAIGFYGFTSWVPIFLATQGVEFTHSLQYSFLIAIINPLGPVARDVSSPIAFSANGRSSCSRSSSPPPGWALRKCARRFRIVFFGIDCHARQCMVLGHLSTTYQAELFPTRIRGQAVGFVYSWSRFSSIFVPFVIAAVLRAQGTLGVFLLIGIGDDLIVALDIGMLGPKTNGRDLDELSPLRMNARDRTRLRFLLLGGAYRYPDEFPDDAHRAPTRLCLWERALLHRPDRARDSLDCANAPRTRLFRLRLCDVGIVVMSVGLLVGRRARN